ncbi:hypothetical protein [Erythrobacter mangrovi]|uniref:Uncharacterized protein n=1 Tax=Erythrobacter mangrovi TaxID=2739433 RepID=A0A7D3XGB7_9SPHN|nr:hypothetical protein [Erythrobacter mangrovi]QKG70373.1 hypothetical protein HQR01_02730 [Erythrobacter mangrovi]
MDRLARFGAVAALIAGVLEVVAQFITHVPDNARLEGLYATIDIAFLIALVALVGLAAGQLGWTGLGLLLLAIVGVASIVGPDKTAFGIDFYRVGSAVFVLALGAAALSLQRVAEYRRPAIAWIGAALLALGAGASGEPLVFRATSMVLALGFILLAPALWRGPKAE